MPNWCDNTLKITGSKKRIAILAKAFEDGDLLKQIMPEPDYDKVDVRPAFPDMNLAFGKDPNVVPKGEAWYDWRIQNWGTKWDVEPGVPEVSPDGKTVEMRFSSAWSPPVGAYKQLVKDGFQVEAMYYEPGNGFIGRFTNDRGEDDYTLNPEGLDDIPEELLEAFGVREEMESLYADD